MYIYTFYKRNNTNEKIHIVALTYCEAVNALYELNNYADYVYDLTTYRLDELWLYKISKNEYCKLMNIGEDYICFPIFINEEQYKKITSKTWYNKTWFNSNINNKIIDKFNEINKHPSNKGINTFVLTYEQI